MTDTAEAKTMGIRSSFDISTTCLANALVFSVHQEVSASEDMQAFVSKIHRTSRRKLLISVKSLAHHGGQAALDSDEWKGRAGDAWPAAFAHASALVPELTEA